MRARQLVARVTSRIGSQIVASAAPAPTTPISSRSATPKSRQDIAPNSPSSASGSTIAPPTSTVARAMR